MMIKSNPEGKMKKKAKSKKETVEPIEIVVIVDRSGSMGSCRDDAEGGLNTFLKEQRKVEASGTITLAQFDSEYDLIHDGIDVKTVPSYTLVPRGMTALYDAIGKTVTTVSERQKKQSYKGKTVVAIVTDGFENSSREWDLARTKSLIAERKLEGWEFIFLAAAEEAMQQGSQLGTIAFNTQGTTYGQSYGAVSVSTVAARQTGADWTDQNVTNLTDVGAVVDKDQDQT